MYRLEMRIVTDVDGMPQKLAGIAVSSLSREVVTALAGNQRIEHALIALQHSASELFAGRQPVAAPADDGTQQMILTLLSQLSANKRPGAVLQKWNKDGSDFLLIRIPPKKD